MKGDTCYFYRCAVLHQGRAKHKYLGYKRIMFLEPGTGMIIHRCIMNDALQIDISIFATDIINGVKSWLIDMKDNEYFDEHYEHFIKRHENGVAPYIVGIPVIA